MEKRWIWPFELLDLLGEGGMGKVYRARYVKNDRVVAVKLLPESINDPTLLSRFEREMQLLKGLRHPNIVHTFGGKCEGDQRFYAMEIIEGGTLDELLRKRGRLSVDTTVEYGVQMCSALAYAHNESIVHRDIKPGNFLLGRDGVLKLSDFGLATFAAANKLTAAGKTMGTFRYMAPEQIRGKPEPCAQTDLYALGVVFFEMLSGQTPFNADAAAEILRMHLKVPAPRVSTLVPGVPRQLDDLILQMMQKGITDRPKSAVEVGLALKGMTGSVEVVRRTSSIASPVTEPMRAAPLSDDSRVIPTRGEGLPRWAIAVPTAIALLALIWGWSQTDEVAALERMESELQTDLSTGSPAEKVIAAELLGKIGRAGDATQAVFLVALEDPEPSVRTATAQAVGQLQDDGKFASGVLKKLQREDDRPEVRQAAGEALKVITGDGGK